MKPTPPLCILTLTAACAPAYIPGAASVAMLEEKGDLHLEAAGGTAGFQADAAYAVNDLIAVRGTLQNYLSVDDPSNTDYGTRFTHFGFGTGVYWAGMKDRGPDGRIKPFGPRLSANYELGPSFARGIYTGTTEGTEYTLRNEGVGFKQSLVLDAAFETPYVSIGLASRQVFYSFWHNENSDHTGNSLLMTTENTLVARAGHPIFQVQAQLGFMLPIWWNDDAYIGAPFPITFNLGVTLDLDTGHRKPIVDDQGL